MSRRKMRARPGRIFVSGPVAWLIAIFGLAVGEAGLAFGGPGPAAGDSHGAESASPGAASTDGPAVCARLPGIFPATAADFDAFLKEVDRQVSKASESAGEEESPGLKGLRRCRDLLVLARTFEEEWRAEFQRLCGQAQAASSLASEELRSLVEESALLVEFFQARAERSQRVFLFRIKKCRSLFQYMLELRESRPSTGEEPSESQ